MGIDGTTLGSTLAVVDWKRSLLETRDYGPFGRVIAQVGDFRLKHQFTGQPSDDTTGLQNYGARMYDARWARFLTPDERIQSFDSQGLNRYSYVSNQPTSMIDPGGEFALGFGGGFGGIGGMSGMSSFGSIGSTGQLPQAASSQGIMSSGPGWPCGDDVCPGDPPLNLLGTEFAELYKAIAQEEEGSQGGGGREDFFTAGALAGATGVIVRNGADASAYLGFTVGRSETGNYGVTETSGGYSVTSEFDDFQRPGGSANSPIRGIEFDAEPSPIPFVVRGGSDTLFNPRLVTHDISFGPATVKVFTINGEVVGGAGIVGFGLGYSRVEGGFTPIFVLQSPLE